MSVVHKAASLIGTGILTTVADPMLPGFGVAVLRIAKSLDKEGLLVSEVVDSSGGVPDMVNHPPHYTGFSNGAEVVDITENLTFNCGNAVKYLARAGRVDGQNKGAVVEDLRKARFYVERELQRLENGE